MKTIKAICLAVVLAGWSEGRGVAAQAPVPDDGPALAPGNGDQPVRVEGELLVKFRGGTRGKSAQRVQAEFGHKGCATLSSLGGNTFNCRQA